MRGTRQRYEHLFDAVPVQVVALDRRCNITAVNARFKSLFGDQVGNKFFDVFTPAAFPAHRDPISLTLSDGRPHQGEMALSGPDHTQHTMMTKTAPILTPSGKMVQVLAIMTDITEYRQMKDHMATLGLMLSTVCHDMKGCLTGLDAGIYHIDRGFYRNIPGRIEEGIEIIRMMTDRIRKLALDVLYSTKERPLELESVEVMAFAGDIASAMEARIRGSNITFNCDFSLCTGRMEIDAGLMRSAIMNILENALEACLEDDQEHPHAIDFIVLSEADHIVMEISDNGKGIPGKELKNIFNVFRSSKGRRGTGLGLYITDKALKKHNGSVEVDSTPGQGTTFRLFLQRRQGDSG
ncbi:MAG: ATP-binding protein [Desulfosarcinaceae bacterium]